MANFMCGGTCSADRAAISRPEIIPVKRHIAIVSERSGMGSRSAKRGLHDPKAH